MAAGKNNVNRRKSDFGKNGKTARRAAPEADIAGWELNGKESRRIAFLNETLLDAIPHPAMLIDKNQEILVSNRKAREGGAEPGGLCWRNFTHCRYIPEKDRQYYEKHGKPPPNGTKCTFCLADKVFNKDGEIRSHEVSMFDGVWDTYWVSLGDDVYLHYAVDVTERKRAEEELQNIAKFPLENPSPVLRVASSGKISDANPASRELMTEWNTGIEDVVPDDWKRVVAAASKTGKPLVIEQKIAERHFSFHVVPVRGADYVNIYGNDVTSLKETQEELQKHKDRLEELVAERTEKLKLAVEELSKKRESLAEAQRIGRMGNWDWNIVTNGLAWSDEIYRIFGLKPQEFGATYDAFLMSVHPDDRDFVKYSVNEAIDKGKPYSIDHRIVLPDGVERVVHEQGEVFRDGDGKAVRMMGTVQDITERKMAEEVLSRLVRMLQMLSDCIESVAHAFNEKDLLDKICKIIVKTGGYRMAWVGYAERDARKSVRPVAQHGVEEGYLETADITWADGERGSGPTGRAIKTGMPQMARNILKDPKFAPWREAALERGYKSSLSLPLVADEGIFGSLNIYSEEPDAFQYDELDLLNKLAENLAYGIKALRMKALRLRADDELREREWQLTLLSRKALSSQEEERARISRDLHDTLGQRLTAITLNIERLEKQSDGAATEKVRRVKEMIAETNDELQRIYKGLRPMALDKLGLEAALESLVWEYRDAHDFKVKASIKPIGCKMEPVTEITVYRIVQEALNNIAKHSGAGRVEVSLRREDAEIVLEVTDDGKGFESGRESDMKGFGMIGMRERAALCGGTLEVKSAPGLGARVTARIPIRGMREETNQ